MHTRLILAMLLMVSYTIPAQAALIDRGGGFIYDSTLNITWLQNANMQRDDLVGDLGQRSWADQVAWAESLIIADTRPGATSLFYDDWRLPTTPNFDPTCSNQYATRSDGFGCTGSELGHLYHVSGVSADNPGPFFNVQDGGYWSGSEYDPATYAAWITVMGSGGQGITGKENPYYYGWAVRDGDVGPALVPIPAAFWLFISALAGLGGLKRRSLSLGVES